MRFSIRLVYRPGLNQNRNLIPNLSIPCYRTAYGAVADCWYHPRMNRFPDLSFTQRTQAVQRALQVLDLFSLASPELSLQEISGRLGMAASTTHRLLKTLEESSWLARVDGTELYRLGPRLLTLSGQMLMQYPVR